MVIACFDMLCNRIKVSVGVDKFCSCEYLEGIKHMSSRMCATHDKSTGVMIVGEVTLAVTLRLIAEAS